MCLGVPGKVTEWLNRDPLLARGWVEFDGLRKVCMLACVPDVEAGDYVVVHAGVAICRIDASQAASMLDAVRSLGESPEVEFEAAP